MDQQEYQRRYLAKLRASLIERLGGKCVKCAALTPLEFAHLKKTPILRLRRGRGLKHRLLDVKKHIDKYCLMCDVCHDISDGRTPAGGQTVCRERSTKSF
jgi:hypothetical protein